MERFGRLAAGEPFRPASSPPSGRDRGGRPRSSSRRERPAASRPAPRAPSPPVLRIAGEDRRRQARRRRRTDVPGSSFGRSARRARKPPTSRAGLGRPGRCATPRPAFPAVQHRHAHAPRLARRLVAARQGERLEGADARPPRAVEDDQFAAPGRAVGAVAVPVERDAERFPLQRFSATTAATWATWCWTAITGRPEDSAERVETKSGCRSQTAHCGSTSRIEVRCRIVSSRKRMVSRSSRSPMCCETNASRPRVTVIVFLRSPPAAMTLGPSAPRSIGSGTKPLRAPQIGGRAVERAHDGIVGPDDDLAVVRHDQVGDAGQAPRARRRRRRPAARRRDWRSSRRARDRTARRARSGNPASPRARAGRASAAGV